MDVSVIAVTLAASMALGLAGAYAAVSLVLFGVSRAVIRADGRLVKTITAT